MATASTSIVTEGASHRVLARAMAPRRESVHNGANRAHVASLLESQ
jgi:hypothetical protein